MQTTLFNMTTIYASLMLPITLGYIERNRRETGETNITSLVFILLLLTLSYIKSDFRWGVLWFNIRSIFM